MRKPAKMQELQSAIISKTWRSVFLRSSWVSSHLTSCPLTSRYKSHSIINCSTISASLVTVLFALCYDVVACSIIKRYSAQALKGTLGFPLIRFEDAIINMYPYTRVHPYETQEMIINDILKHFKEVINILHSQMFHLHLNFILYVVVWVFASPQCDSSALELTSSFCRSLSVRRLRSWAQWTSWATPWAYWMMSLRVWMNSSSTATLEGSSAVLHMVFPTQLPR